MESLIGLVNRIQRACTVLGDHGGEGSLWEALPSVAVVGGQVTPILAYRDPEAVGVATSQDGERVGVCGVPSCP
ncbi:hypothetical protein BHE74_00032427 [Ensete ventricosum]|nr:hypothetical protein BHE74_00032427 [Ensete ventricosum]RZR78628.1 hypothetical protein BHM03_00004040 [Ensete ventricosum]